MPDCAPVRIAYARRDRDLDPQLVWRGKDESDLIVQAPPLYIQEKVHPKALVDDLTRASDGAPDLFADFNGVPEGAARTEFYRHDANWANRMVLGDALRVMGGLAERDGLRGKVQCVYIDPPYGIRFNSNFQWSTTSRDVKDGKKEHITREPEQVKAFRDTWRDGIHSYLSYLRDRLTVARDLLADSGSVFVQIGDENVHRVRLLMDEVFGERNNVSLISFNMTSGVSSDILSGVNDHLLWYAKDRRQIKYRQPYNIKRPLHNPRRLWSGRFLQKPFRTQPALFVSAAELDRPALRALDDAESLPGQSEIERPLSSMDGSRMGRAGYPLPIPLRGLVARRAVRVFGRSAIAAPVPRSAALS